MVSNLAMSRVFKILPLILSKLHLAIEKAFSSTWGRYNLLFYNLSTSKKQESSKEEVKKWIGLL